MNHNSPFDGMIVFCSIVENNGFGAAANNLGHAPSHISKSLAELERRLGTRLLNRTTRTLSLTSAGEAYYRSAVQIIQDAQFAGDQLIESALLPTGFLKIGVPISLAQTCLNSWLGEFLKSYPDIRLEVEASERMVDIVGEGFDLVVRVGSLVDSQHIARKLSVTNSVVIASPEYLSTHGKPDRPDQLGDHSIIAFGNNNEPVTWRFSKPGSPNVKIVLPTRLKCNSAHMELEMAVAGLGITRLPRFVCQSKLDSGELVNLFEDHEPPKIDIHAIYASRKNLPVKVRVLIDFLVGKFSAHL